MKDVDSDNLRQGYVKEDFNRCAKF